VKPRTLILAGVLLLGACTTVKPWQREDLSRRTMVDDNAAGEARFGDHSRAAREGAVGGGGEAGGGCGCN
jgi:hypothetical protein